MSCPSDSNPLSNLAKSAYSANSTSVQPQGWQAALPRPEYQVYEKITLEEDCGWYEVYGVLPGVYAIYEPGHFQEVISYLIIGDKRALLWDTGMGIAPIRPLVKSLTHLPIMAINSHNHFDHVGGNWEFPEVLAWPGPDGGPRAAAGYSREFLLPMMAEDSLSKPLPADFQAGSYAIRPWHMVPLSLRASGWLEEVTIPSPPPDSPASASVSGPAIDLRTGLAFDLGTRRLELLYTPGHTPDSIMLLDATAGILFTGDTVYPAALYAHFDSSEYGQSSLDVYAKTMNSLQSLSSTLSFLCCSHNIPLNKPSMLNDIAAGFQNILKSQSTGYLDEEGLLRYDFQGFAIITTNHK